MKDLLTIEALCGLETPDPQSQGADKGEESEEEDSEELVTLEKIDEFVTMLKAISVGVDKMPVAYASIAQVVNDLSEHLRSKLS